MDIDTRSGPAIVLTFDRTDPTGAAGLQSDVLTAACLGCHPLSVATALSVQDTAGIVRIDALPAAAVDEQARVLLADLAPDVFRIGFVAGEAQVEAIARCVAQVPAAPVVLAAPFLLLDGPTRSALRLLLLPHVGVIVADAQGLVQLHRTDDDPAAAVDVDAADAAPDIRMALERTFALGARHVLLTGEDRTVDRITATLHAPGDMRDLESRPRLPRTFHGARDTLACALAALLANGLPLEAAAAEALEFTWQALAHARAPGRGRHVPDRFFWARHASVAPTA
jgi:hydroxymethylpyrimidine/phosphomethylpyrimidine kinase